MALRGNLKDFSLPDVFQLVTFSRKTGVLRIVREDGATGSVWFREGEVFFASSNWHTEPLGERLVKAQRITRQALDRGLKVRESEGDGGRRLGQILVDEGYITEKVLETFVADQIQDTIFDLMRWDEGEFDFEAMPEVVEEDIGLSVSIENIVMEGSRRLEEWTRILKKIPSMDVVFKMATAPGEGTFEISLKPAEWQLLLLIDGTRSVAELAHATSRTDFEVARVVYGLFSAGLLEFATDEEVEKLRAERVEREAKLAEIDNERKAAEEAAKKAALEREAKLAAEAQARQAAAEKDAEARRVAAAAQAAQEAAEARATEERELAEQRDREAIEAARAARTEPEEVPEFIGGGAASSAEDAMALEEIMGAVLERPAEPVQAEVPEESEPVAPAVPYVPAEEPAFMGVAGDEGLAPAPSIEDLLAGTGLEPVAPEPEPEPEPEPVAVPEPEPELVVEPEPEPEPVVEVAPEPALEPEPEPVSEVVAAPQIESVAELEVPAFEAEPVAELAFETEPEAVAFERDLMSLGLGELPSDLLEPIGAPEAVAPLEPVAEPMSELPAQEVTFPQWEVEPAAEPVAVEPVEVEPVTFETPAVEAEPAMDAELEALVSDLGLPLEVPAAPVVEEALEEAPDFSELLESLDVDAQAETPTVEVTPEDAGFDTDLLLDEEPVVGGGGVISTDAFLEDIGMEEMGLSGGLTDELSALTGAVRKGPARPQASVNAIPEAGEGILHRDTRVDKDTLMKIIDGIKNL